MIKKFILTPYIKILSTAPAQNKNLNKSIIRRINNIKI